MSTTSYTLGMCLYNERKFLGVALYVECTVSKYPNKPFTSLAMWLFLLVSIHIPPFLLTKWPRKGCSGIFGPIPWFSLSQIILANQITAWPRVYQNHARNSSGTSLKLQFDFSVTDDWRYSIHWPSIMLAEVVG